MAIHQIPSCCTASLVHELPVHESNVAIRIDESIASGLRLRQAIVQAYTTAAQANANRVLEQKGFVKVADVVDYKYPSTSKRLFLWVLDLNTKINVPVPVAPVVNPFQAPAAAPMPELTRRVRAWQPRDQRGRFVGYGEPIIFDESLPIPESYNGRAGAYRIRAEGAWYATADLEMSLRAVRTLHRPHLEFKFTH